MHMQLQTARSRSAASFGRGMSRFWFLCSPWRRRYPRDHWLLFQYYQLYLFKIDTRQPWFCVKNYKWCWSCCWPSSRSLRTHKEQLGGCNGWRWCCWSPSCLCLILCLRMSTISSLIRMRKTGDARWWVFSEVMVNNWIQSAGKCEFLEEAGYSTILYHCSLPFPLLIQNILKWKYRGLGGDHIKLQVLLTLFFCFAIRRKQHVHKDDPLSPQLIWDIEF